MPNIIRTTIRPDVELEVDDAELANLRGLGLVLDTTATTDTGLQKAAERQVAASAPQAAPQAKAPRERAPRAPRKQAAPAAAPSSSTSDAESPATTPATEV